MTARGATPQVVILLLILGASCVALRWNARKSETPMPGDKAWRLTYVVNFHARTDQAKVVAAYPENTRHAHVVKHNFPDPSLKPEPSRAGKEVRRRGHRGSRAEGRALRVPRLVRRSSEPAWLAERDGREAAHAGNP